MKGRRTVLAALAGALISVPAFSEPMRAVEGEAIAAYLNSQEPGERAKKTLVIVLTTVSASDPWMSESPDKEGLKRAMPQATDAVVSDFLRVIASPSALYLPRPLVHRNLRVQMVSQAAIDRIFDDEGGNSSLGLIWRNFYKAYPEAGRLVHFSRVGIDEQSSQALFFVSLRYGGLGGQGFYVLLHRRFGMWRVLAIEQAWIS